MNKHKTVSHLRYRRTGANIYLEIGFDARPDDQPGAQWLTIQPRVDAPTSGQPVNARLPRDVTDGEKTVQIGSVRRQIIVEHDPSSSERRWIRLSVAGNSPYCILRHTRTDDGAVLAEEVYPLPPEPEGPQVVPLIAL